MVVEQFFQYHHLNTQICNKKRAAKRSRIDALRAICQATADTKIHGVHLYFAKKILEMLILLALNRLTLYCERGDLHYLTDVYPLPKNTTKSLKVIFPSIQPSNVREAMAALGRVTKKDVTLLVPMLCWQLQEQRRNFL